VIDNRSEDQSIKIIEGYQSNRNLDLKIISEKDRGIYDAINKGIKAANGNWIYIIGSDDYLLDNNVFSDVFSSNSIHESDVLYGNVKWGNKPMPYDGKFNWIKLLKKNICHQAMFFKKELFERYGLYKLNYPQLADYEFNLRLFNDPEVKFAYLDRNIAYFSGEGVSHNNEDIFKSEFKNSIKWQIINNKNSILKIQYFLDYYKMKGFYKSYLEFRQFLNWQNINKKSIKL
jgi:glycosyltransferase involved in cell wall biosynthesis